MPVHWPQPDVLRLADPAVAAGHAELVPVLVQAPMEQCNKVCVPRSHGDVAVGSK